MEPITYTNIVVEGVPFTKVLALEIAHAINEHGTAAIVGEMEVDAAREYLNRMDENAAIKITTTAEGQLSVLFYGLLTNVGVEQEAEYATLTLTAATTSALLDIQPVNRSYQKTSATYGQVMEAALNGAGAVNMKVTDQATGKMLVKGGLIKDATAMPKRIAPGIGTCPGCGIPVNLNLLLKGIEGNVVFLFQTGCGMVTTTAYPKTAFRIPYIHNLFQNGAATLSGLVEVFEERQKRGEYPKGEITFIMASGDGGMDIGMGSALGTALRGHHLLLFEYDNGGYMNTGYQLSYSTPMGAKSSTSHLGKTQYGKTFFHKDMPQIMAATHLPYVATVAESNPHDFIKKAAKAAAYAREFGTAYVKALSACPLNWNDRPDTERKVIAAAVDCCYFPLYEIERGITSLSYDPNKSHKKIPVTEWFSMKFSFKLSSVCSDKLKLICSCMNSKFFFHLTQCTFHQFIPGTDMPCGRNIIRSRVRIFTFTSFLKEYIITTLLIRTYNPDVYR